MTDVGDRSAVEVFGDWHDGGDASDTAVLTADGATYLRALPASAPGAGRQYRFEVDLDSCTGCKSCVSACHSMNGLDVDETWRSVGLLVGGGDGPGPSWQQHVTTACHHCLEPACLAGCPVDAYDKDPITGIVAHLDDQCIGCRYCMLTCPYDVPTFNSRLGVVRKCDMCSDRLAVGEAPACVQGCPTDAISIGVVDTAALAAELAVTPDGRLVPTAPRSAATGPTTVYLTRRRVPTDASAGDDHRLVPASNHPPLVAMLVLTQVSVGAFVLGQLGSSFGNWFGTAGRVGAGPAALAWSTALVAILASVLHLGRPAVAWRAVLGVGHSWLSREIVAFGVYAALGGAAAAGAVGLLPHSSAEPLGVVTALAGLAGVGCSVQLYAVTGRAFWRVDRTSARFVVTTAVGGAAALATVASLAEATGTGPTRAAEVRSVAAWVVVAGVCAAVAAAVIFVVRHRRAADALGRSARLMVGPLRRSVLLAGALGLAGAAVGAGSAAAELAPTPSAAAWAVVLLTVIAASWIERGLFFVAVAPDRMPGGFH